MSLLTDNRDALCEELCQYCGGNQEDWQSPVSTVDHPANSVWTTAIHQNVKVQCKM